ARRCAARGRDPRRAPGWVAGCSRLRHERVSEAPRWDEVLLHRARACPPHQIQQASRLVVGSARACTTERLLAHYGARGLVVHVEVARGVAECLLRLRHGTAIL